MIRELFNNKKFIFIFTFVIEVIFYYLFESKMYTGTYLFPDIGLAPAIGLVFGPVGALGTALAALICSILDNNLIVGSLIDSFIMFFISVLVYKLWYNVFTKKSIAAPRLDSSYNILKLLYIMTVSSIIYWAIIGLTFEAYPGFSNIYPLTDRIFRVSYILDNFTFSILFSLVFISIFNYFRLPFQYPKKWFSKLNIDYRYFAVTNMLIFGYLILAFNDFVIDNDVLDNLFFFFMIANSLLFLLNNSETDINSKMHNFSIIERIILIFLLVLLLLTLGGFEFVYTVMRIDFPTFDLSYVFLITISLVTVVVLLFSLIHIYTVEKDLTNPIYDLIQFTEDYKETKNPENMYKGLKKYENHDDVGALIKTFVGLYEKITARLDTIEKVTAETEHFETEFNIMSGIQRNMLPENFEEFSQDRPFEIYAYMKPAREVGGDFYDFFDIDDDTIGFDIGDVSGKGVPATLFMVKTQYLIGSHSQFGDDLSVVVGDVNDLACSRNDENLFVTSWIGQLDLKNGKLTYVNAGHNPPLISRANQDAEYLISDPNIVIGVMEGIEYEKHVITLNPGDMILLYTDGITEANDNYKGFYGEDRLRDVVNKNKNRPLSEIISRINEDIGDFCSHQEQFDDSTMIVIRYTGGENNG